MNVVFNPMITSPQANDVWPIGTLQTVTWQTNEIPVEERNSTGSLLLGWVDSASQNEHLDIGERFKSKLNIVYIALVLTRSTLFLAHPLAVGFALMDGKVDVSVPIVDTRDDYIVVREY